MGREQFRCKRTGHCIRCALYFCYYKYKFWRNANLITLCKIVGHKLDGERRKEWPIRRRKHAPYVRDNWKGGQTVTLTFIVLLAWPGLGRNTSGSQPTILRSNETTQQRCPHIWWMLMSMRAGWAGEKRSSEKRRKPLHQIGNNCCWDGKGECGMDAYVAAIIHAEFLFYL